MASLGQNLFEKNKSPPSISVLSADLEKAVQEHSESLALLTHEVRSSLGAIMGFVESLYDAKLTVKERFHCIRKVTDTIVQTSRILEDLEHLNSIENGALSLRSVRFRLEDELANIFQFLQSYARKSELRLEIRTDGPVPEYVLSDPLRLREILTNLVDLTIQKTERGTVRVTLQLSKEAEPKLEFIFDSTGHNLPKDTLTHDVPWNQSMTSDFVIPEIHGRTLIGISLVKSLARVLGGEVRLERSQMGHGQAIKVRIDPGPLERTMLKEGLNLSQPEAASAVTPLQIPDLAGKRFLVIEDDADIAALMQSFLSKTKASVDVARTGTDGLNRAMEKSYNLIFMDLQIPELNGIEVSQRLRENHNDTPIIAITANASVIAKSKALAAGCNLF